LPPWREQKLLPVVVAPVVVVVEDLAMVVLAVAKETPNLFRKRTRTMVNLPTKQ
jgi:hypothetical protein